MRSIKKPRGHRISSSANTKRHFDYNNCIYAKDHYGKYLIVKNTKVDTSKHNRIYISRVEQIEFIKHADNVYPEEIRQGADKRFKNPTQFHILDRFPKYQELIWNLLFKLEEKSTRPYTTSIIKGLGSILDILINTDKNLTLKDADSFHHTHHASIQESITLKQYGTFDYISAAWKHIIKLRSEQDLPISFNKRETINSSKNQAIPLDIVFQLDYYAQKELDEILSHINQLEEWSKEYDSIDELFSLENLTYSYYKESSKQGNWSTLNKIAIELYNIDLLCYTQTKLDKLGTRCYSYKDEEQRQQHKKLLYIAKDGMDININNKKMIIFWLKRISEDFPLLTKYKAPFKNIWKSPLKVTAQVRCKKIGIDLSDLINMITPQPKHLYPLFLILLIRTGVNQEVIRTWSVTKMGNGQYELGEKWGQGIMIAGNKYRGNTKQVSIISKKSVEEKYLKAFLNWLYPIYDISSSSNFFQYVSLEGKIAVFSKKVLKNLLSNKYSFFHKYQIYDDGKRIYSIDHRYLRASKNYSRYLEGYGKWVREKELGHQGESTESKHYRKSNEWRIGSRHQIASSQNQLISFIKGENNNERLSKAFQTPFCECSDPQNPTYKNAKKIEDDDVCTSWRKCLTECNNQKSVIPSVHGPLITAWRDLMEEKKGDFWLTEDWEKEFLLDIDTANSILDQFTEDEKALCSQQATKYTQFINSLLLKAIQNETKRV